MAKRGPKPQGRRKILAHVLGETDTEIRALVNKSDSARNSIGKVLDHAFKRKKKESK